MGWWALDKQGVESNVDITSGVERGGEGVEKEAKGEPEDELGT